MTIEVKLNLTQAGLMSGDNDTAFAGHAIATGCTLVTTMCVNSAVWRRCVTKMGFTEVEHVVL
jgi:hypothetical protein